MAPAASARRAWECTDPSEWTAAAAASWTSSRGFFVQRSGGLGGLAERLQGSDHFLIPALDPGVLRWKLGHVFPPGCNDAARESYFIKCKQKVKNSQEKCGLLNGLCCGCATLCTMTAKPDELKSIVTALAADIGVRTYGDSAQPAAGSRTDLAGVRVSGICCFQADLSVRRSRYENMIGRTARAGSCRKRCLSSGHITILSLPRRVLTTTRAEWRPCSASPGSLRRNGFPRTVRFAAFTLEEPPAYRTPNMGSYHYARSLKEAGAAVEGMICLEMVGYFSDLPGSQSYPLPFFKLKYPSRGNFIAMVGNMRSRTFYGGYSCGCAEGRRPSGRDAERASHRGRDRFFRSLVLQPVPVQCVHGH